MPRHNLDTTKTVGELQLSLYRRSFVVLSFSWCFVALKCFKKEVFDLVKEKVRLAVLELAHKEREGDSIDHLLVKNVVQVPLPHVA